MSKWNKGVELYAQELKEFLANEGMEATEHNLLNGAIDWKQYSYGGSSLIYNGDIADRLATPSEIKRRTLKDGSLATMASPTETWLDVQARALYQAAQVVLGEA